MPPQKPKRDRGVILTLHGWDKLQAVKSEAEFQENAGDRFTLEELSERTGLSLRTISKVLGRLEPVDKYSLQTFFQSFGLELSKSDYTRPASPFKTLEIRQQNPQQDWGEAVDVSVFYGRAEELTTLRRWVLEEHCRLLALLGIGGIGKSTLSVKLAWQIQQEFEVVVWRSLQNAPPLKEWLGNVVSFLLQAQNQDPELPDSVDERLSKLMECLRTSRCLLILDNVETILSGYVVLKHQASVAEIAIAFITRYISQLLQRQHSTVLLTINLPSWKTVNFSLYAQVWSWVCPLGVALNVVNLPDSL